MQALGARDNVVELMFSAASNDLRAVKRLYVAGVGLNSVRALSDAHQRPLRLRTR